ncbi:MAG: UPF0182 family protein, partial [Planctomycetota bacterium]|nr:UPF0182 family protein [Planctomycetota bacterium]
MDVHTTRPPGPFLDIPTAPPARAPSATRLWSRMMVVAWVLLGAFLLDRLALVLMNYWLLESLGFESIFWTNFKTGAILFCAGLASSIFVIGPALVCAVGPTLRRVVVHAGLLWGILSGYLLSLEFLTFLMAGGQEFGTTDPVFHNDVSFYVFTLPPFWTAWWFLAGGTFLAVCSWMLCTYNAYRKDESVPGLTRLSGFFATVGTKGTRITLGVLGVLGAIGWWLSRYDVLLMDNTDSSVFTGASYVDATGLFSTINDYHFTALVTLGITALVIVMLARLNKYVTGGAESAPKFGKLNKWVLILLLLDFGFKGVVSVRQAIFVKPNEPVIQMKFIGEHINATRDAYNLGDIRTIPLVPKDVGDPLPDVDQLLKSPTLRNAPLWPGYCSYLEDLVDIQHKERILKTDGDSMVYGPVLDIFRQQQKLRAYYNFLDIDTIRADVDGEPTMLVSSVREVPLVEPAPWLAWWGQQYMLFTHGFGLVTATTAEVTNEGNPVYVSKGIPVESRAPALAASNQRVYYGEGSGSMAYSNVREMTELDYPTDEDRAVTTFPQSVKAGVKIDSFLKRLVFGYKSGQFFEIVFSELINDDTRVHYYRMPIERLQQVAPAIYYDPNAFAVVADGKITWMVNGLTWADAYPYAEFMDLGDKSDLRSPRPVKHQTVNYVRDAVKATVDGYTGKLTLYKFADEPVLNTLADIYPDLFTAESEMPASVRKQLQYPTQLLHVQFDDLYVVYQMKDPMTFFNMEDMWDDADEVLGPIMDQ